MWYVLCKMSNLNCFGWTNVWKKTFTEPNWKVWMWSQPKRCTQTIYLFKSEQRFHYFFVLILFFLFFFLLWRFFNSFCQSRKKNNYTQCGLNSSNDGNDHSVREANVLLTEISPGLPSTKKKEKKNKIKMIQQQRQREKKTNQRWNKHT